MKLKKIFYRIIAKKHGYCEGCYRKAELTRVKVSSYSGMPSFKYLCSTCEALESFKKY